MAPRRGSLTHRTVADALANFTTNASGASFTVQNGRNFTTGGTFSNAGTLAVGTGSTFTAGGDYTQTAGTTSLQGGTLAATGVKDLQGGVLSGNGTVSGDLTNEAMLSPGDSPGSITITGNYTQTSAGTLVIELGGASPGQFDTLQVSGNAALDGTLDVALIGGFVPTPPQSFQVLTFGSRSGDFATKNGLELGGGLYLVAAYRGSSLTLTTAQATIVVDPTSGLVTTEAGGTATFTVVLGSQPTDDVTIGLSSSDTTEGTVAPSSLTFTPANWNVAQTVTVTGVDDFVQDGDVVYTIITAPAVSTDPHYAASMPPTSGHQPRQRHGGIVRDADLRAGHHGGGRHRHVQRGAEQPAGRRRHRRLSSSNTAEGTVAPAALTFTAANWNVAQTVTVTGVDDFVADGNVAYTIITAPPQSADPIYARLNPANVRSPTSTTTPQASPSPQPPG